MELNFDSLEFCVSEPSDNAQVVFSTRKMVEQIGFDPAAQYLIAAAVSELSTNIIRYADKGMIYLNHLEARGLQGFEVIASDQGPGIADIPKAMEDNYSSGEGLGLGLPSVKRIMDEFEIISEPGRGTRIRAAKWMNK